ncbi:hypothetical protein [Natrinema salsiterrestre]|uniref:Uncharacterized protein n=1 Tax=Natrinema salsiterrestre TaxID=2950540 RepID=A0A9Q4L112_9EURY|nr:hypothetical protein [Natrinema salsiterrestre]MDF9744522.1 hypothetical protein [Natrinema salsiterrestre]
MVDRNLTTIDGYPSEGRATRAILRFAKNLSERSTRSERRGIIFGKKPLQPEEVDIGFKPEAFTRHNLVRPLLNAAGLEYQPEPRGGEQQETYPDFLITNTDVEIIGEVKPVNRIFEGKEQLRSYLSTGAFDASYGILTDGIEWRIYTSVGTHDFSGVSQASNSVSLRDTLKSLAYEEELIQMDPGRATRARELNKIDEFLHTFHKERLNTWILYQLPEDEKRAFLDETGGSQFALDDFSVGE